MKFMLGLIVCVALVFVALFALGAFEADDPKVQADEIRNTVKPGMTWEQVCEIREPRKYVLGSMTAIDGTSSPIKFDRAEIAEKLAQKKFALGFGFQYLFSSADAVQVMFDEQGQVVSVTDMMTVKDLFNTHQPTTTR